MSKINISIIVPVYNVETYIERCARSLFEQTLQDGVEFIFVDDASPDNSMQILSDTLKMHPERMCQVKIIRHEVNRGLAMARLSGINTAKGEFILHVDSDDYLTSNALSDFVNAAEKDENADIIIGRYQDVYRNKTKIAQISKVEVPNELVKLMVMRLTPCNIWNRLIRRRLYDNIYIPRINNGEDYVTMPRLLLKAKKIVYLENITYCYSHLNPTSFLNTFSSPKNISDFAASIEFLENSFIDINELKYPLIIARLKYYGMLMFYCSDNKDVRKIVIPKQLKSYILRKEVGNMRAIILLHLFKLYNVIRLLNKLYVYLQIKK